MTSSHNPLLDGIRVLDLSRVLAGPFCTMTLGDLGADVIKVEQPGSGDDTRHWGPPFTESGLSAYYLCANRNKRSLTLNLKTEDGQRIVRELIRQSDVLIENFKAGTLEGWGLSYDTLQELRPGLIYCTITGYGYGNAFSDQAGYDFIIQALGGLMSITGPADGEPYKVGVAITDIMTGQFAANAILAALFARERTGDGQRIDMALFDAQVAMLANVASNYLVSGKPPRRFGNAHPNIVPYQTFKASDIYFAIGVGNDSQWRKLCDAIGKPEWGTDTRYAKNEARVENRTELIPLLADVFVSRPAADWITLLETLGIPGAPINSVDRVFADPRVAARRLRIEAEHPTSGMLPMVASPLNIPTAPVQVRYAPPILGEHTDAILSEMLGYDEARIAALRNTNVI
ncbi:MAG: CoA transferase [Anaerolineae bacterium]|nr:CoA transferase [Anaerolineae bacterium]